MFCLQSLNDRDFKWYFQVFLMIFTWEFWFLIQFFFIGPFFWYQLGTGANTLRIAFSASDEEEEFDNCKEFVNSWLGISLNIAFSAENVKLLKR